MWIDQAPTKHSEQPIRDHLLEYSDLKEKVLHQTAGGNKCTKRGYFYEYDRNHFHLQGRIIPGWLRSLEKDVNECIQGWK